MLSLAFFSMLGDSQTMDEVSHLPAGYSYITQHDMRINPEHPPLMKDMAGLGVWIWSKISGTQINFPSEIKAWKDDINGQWDFGFNFMYYSGNNADGMLIAGRLPMFLILLILGIYIFKWSKKLFGSKTALLALFFYSFSPTFIAHGRLVTTDVAASAAIFISLYYFVGWLKTPNTKNVIIAGVIFGLALCAKFSVFLLIPLFVFLIVIWLISSVVIARSETTKQSRDTTTGSPRSPIGSLAMIVKYLGGFILLGLVSLLVIYIIYIPHVWNYPMERQINDMRFVLNLYGNGPDQTPLASCINPSRISRCPAEITIWMATKPILRPLAQYLYGLLMVVQRATGGNTTYFLGEVSATGWASYFPIVYAIKEPLAMHILTIIALLFAAYSTKSFWKKPISGLFNWINGHIAEFAMLSFIALYWYSSISSPLNIGVRHVLPTFPFIYILISNQIIKWLSIKEPEKKDDLTAYEKLKFLEHAFFGSILKYSILGILLLWQLVSVVSTYPYFLTYFNETIGGPKNGHIYAADSNLDWGQDFKRLAKWVEENNVQRIYVDYFGGTVGEYYLGNKLIPWSGQKNPNLMAPNSYLAVSATFRQQCFGKPVAGFEPLNCYQWLKNYEPVEVIGNSIFVYYIP
ncbi:MAG: hypothetical protein A2175_01110 [Candidatus Nealsonbacteria bacterium RBG_13_42_11]|uniref:Glycosyltransferase RgtA/B/C/D-like domain-containing protein n=1 Tax=Candidatus Nealsonbacteria bacterium RBG_13_42_11 TaxID=1801663 RepID=A0A1G2DZL6_9BACT|nr:MAG: hypothetical protein A2175_01110 [Candidatus Nealsonbacteria bacterium RBG_13_42_11]